MKEIKESFCALTSDNITDGEKRNINCMPALNDRDHDPPAYLEHLLNWPCLLDFFPENCLTRIHLSSYCTYQVFYEILFFIKSKLC